MGQQSQDLHSTKLPQRDFKLGDKVRVRSAWLDKKGDVYEVDVITPTAVRAFNGDTVLTLRKEKWVHAD